MPQVTSIDLVVGGEQRSDTVVTTTAGDKNSLVIQANFKTIGGGNYTLQPDTSVFFECITNSGKAYRIKAKEMPQQDSSAKVKISKPFTVAGTITVAYFRLEYTYDSEAVYESTQPFTLIVQDSISTIEITKEETSVIDWHEVQAEIDKQLENVRNNVNVASSEVSIVKDNAINQINGSTAKVDDEIKKLQDKTSEAIDGANSAVAKEIKTLQDKTAEAVQNSKDAIDGTTAGKLQNDVVDLRNQNTKVSNDVSAIKNRIVNSFPELNIANAANGTNTVNDLNSGTVVYSGTFFFDGTVKIANAPYELQQGVPFTLYVSQVAASMSVQQLVPAYKLGSESEFAPVYTRTYSFSSSEFSAWNGGKLPDVIPVTRGGTGATTAIGALESLGSASQTQVDSIAKQTDRISAEQDVIHSGLQSIESEVAKIPAISTSLLNKYTAAQIGNFVILQSKVIVANVTINTQFGQSGKTSQSLYRPQHYPPGIKFKEPPYVSYSLTSSAKENSTFWVNTDNEETALIMPPSFYFYRPDGNTIVIEQANVSVLVVGIVS